jgi:NAD-dependent SIR2 family protein deacetylase
MPEIDKLPAAIQTAARWLRDADALLITAGAGMGVDSGLPNFRGQGGFWAAYPALGRARIDFREIANPAAFMADPRLAWGFYGHRLRLYRATTPHRGFAILMHLAARLEHGAFVYTSNVDGQFQKAGFAPARIYECHGSIHHLQCQLPCEPRIWSAATFQPVVNQDTCQLESPLPHCSQCGGIARPNILMFEDWHWLDRRADGQRAKLQAWLATVKRPVAIELGAGTAIATVRSFGESMGYPLIRVNPTDADVGGRESVSIPLGAMAALEMLEKAMA